MKKNIVLLLIIIVASLTISTSLNYATDSKVSINSVSSQSLYVNLVEIDGIGPKIASKAVEYRDKYKPIKVRDLILVKGIGPKRLALIKQKFKE